MLKAETVDIPTYDGIKDKIDRNRNYVMNIQQNMEEVYKSHGHDVVEYNLNQIDENLDKIREEIENLQPDPEIIEELQKEVNHKKRILQSKMKEEDE